LLAKISGLFSLPDSNNVREKKAAAGFSMHAHVGALAQ
jgi:hypothetical protein